MSLAASAPEWLGYLLVLGARWLVTLSALAEASYSIVNVMGRSVGRLCWVML